MYDAEGVSRRHVKNVTKLSKTVTFGDFIWYHHLECVQVSTNMPGIGLVLREIASVLTIPAYH